MQACSAVISQHIGLIFTHCITNVIHVHVHVHSVHESTCTCAQGSFFFEKRGSYPVCISLPLLACHVHVHVYMHAMKRWQC